MPRRSSSVLPVGFSPNLSLDQHFLVSSKVEKAIGSALKLSKSDSLVEIGPGFGIFSAILAKKVKEYVGIECDPRFRESLTANLSSPQSQVIYANAIEYLCSKEQKEFWHFTKVYSNVPFSICEPLFYYLCGVAFHRGVFLVPESFVDVLGKNRFFSSFFVITSLLSVPSSSYMPPPRTDTVLILVEKREPSTLSLQLSQEFFLQRDKKVKNLLRKLLRDQAEKAHSVKITKLEAKGIVLTLGIDDSILSKVSMMLKPREMDQITQACEKKNLFMQVAKLVPVASKRISKK